MHLVNRSWPVGIAALALASLGVGVAVAASPSAPAVVSTCYESKGGNLRVVSIGAHAGGGRCKRGEKRLSLNQTSPRGLTGTPGAQGARGPQGAQGIQGAQGVPGAQGIQGVPGPTTTTAPSGSTQRGAFVLEGYQTMFNFIGSAISYPLELSAEPLEIEVPFSGTNPDPTHCPGTPAAPTAARGYLCIYDRFSGNVLQTTGTNLQVADVDGVGGTTNVWGARIVARANATGTVDVEGTWAVTAP
jgi:hypothetical protein